jgi:hypothetical protein
VNVPLSAEQIDWIDTKARQRSLSHSDFLRMLLARYKAAQSRSEAAHSESEHASDVAAEHEDADSPASMFDLASQPWSTSS